VKKYSPEQAAYAALVSGIPDPDGAVLAAVCGEPADGITWHEGNTLVTVGLDNLTKVLTGAGGVTLAQAHTIAGVGSSTANNAAPGDTALAADNTAGAWYQNVDSGNPTQANGVISCNCTFGTGVANYAWNEWCLAVTSGSITPGNHLSAAASPAPVMINHKMYAGGSGLGGGGSKGGAAWVLSATITLS